MEPLEKYIEGIIRKCNSYERTLPSGIQHHFELKDVIERNLHCYDVYVNGCYEGTVLCASEYDALCALGLPSFHTDIYKSYTIF